MFRKVLLFVLLTALLGSCFGCAGTEKGALTKVRLSEVTHSVFYAAQYVALEKGYFQEEGLSVELTNAGGADKAMTALLSGQADLALMGPEASVYVYNEGREDFTQVIGQLTARDGAFIVGRDKDEDFTLETLRGKSILGGRAGGMPLMALEYALRQNGLTPGEDVNVRDDVQFGVMAGAFAGGEGDYTTLFEPTASAFEREGGGYVLAAVGDFAGPCPYTCYQVTKSGLKANEKMLLSFLRAIYKGQCFIRDNAAEEIAKVIQPSFADEDPAVLASAIARYKSIDAYALTPILEREPYETLLTIMEEAGELSARPPYDEVVNNALAEKVLQP